MNRFVTLDYLRGGSSSQRRAYAVLHDCGIFDLLRPYEPLLAGTVPLGIDVEGSDLDIVCRISSVEGFAAFAEQAFGERAGFEMHRRGGDTVVVRFYADGMPVEIFASPTPSARSAAWRHMLVEERIMALAGDDFRRRVICLKRCGVKTEPAFARLLRLDGDPFAAVLALENASDREILDLCFGGKDVYLHSQTANYEI